MSMRAMLLLCALGLAIGLIPAATVEAGCYTCDTVDGCIETCRNTNGSDNCSHVVTCTGSSCTVTYCHTSGSSCFGERDCTGSCSPALEECTFDIQGASLVIPNGAIPQGGLWLERKARELRVCGTTGETTHSPEAVQRPARAPRVQLGISNRVFSG